MSFTRRADGCMYLLSKREDQRVTKVRWTLALLHFLTVCAAVVKLPKSTFIQVSQVLASLTKLALNNPPTNQTSNFTANQPRKTTGAELLPYITQELQNYNCNQLTVLFFGSYSPSQLIKYSVVWSHLILCLTKWNSCN